MMLYRTNKYRIIRPPTNQDEETNAVGFVFELVALIRQTQRNEISLLTHNNISNHFFVFFAPNIHHQVLRTNNVHRRSISYH